MRVVVVGHTGNVGSAVVRALASDSTIELVGVARRRPEPRGPWSRVDARTIDVADRGSVPALTEAFRRADAVVHLAWALQPNHHPVSMARTNVGGLGRVLAAASAAGVAQTVVASSVGAYSLGPKRTRVDESWPTGGIHSSHYSRFKAQGERIMDAVEAAGSEMILTRMRPGLVMQHDAASEIARLFFGPVAPLQILATTGIPLVPLPARLVSQVVHADDLAAAIVAALRLRRGGAFNIAAEPTIGPREVAAAVGGRWLPVRQGALRALASATWRLRLQASDPGWLDLSCAVPVMDTRRARDELGWMPVTDARDALGTIVRGLRERGSASDSPPLR